MIYMDDVENWDNWDVFKSFLDADDNHAISEEEWVWGWTEFLSFNYQCELRDSATGLNLGREESGHQIFRYIDEQTNNDGQVDEAEFRHIWDNPTDVEIPGWGTISFGDFFESCKWDW